MRDTWTSRDLPVLTAIVEGYERSGQSMHPNDIIEQSGLPAEDVHAALRALVTEDPPFLTNTTRRAAGGISRVGTPTGHARRAVGAWPTAESLADQLLSVLEQAADREPDEERKRALRRVAAYFGNTGRDLLVEIGAAFISRQMGM